jgi:hypothetical protein
VERAGKDLPLHGIGHWRAGCGYKPHARFGGGSSEKGLFAANRHLVGDLPYGTPGSEGGRAEKGPHSRHLAARPTLPQESNGRAQTYEARRCGARAIWLKLDCLHPNLQEVQFDSRRKDA